MRSQAFLVILGLLFLGLSFIFVDHASGQIAPVEPVITLSAAGYERAHALAFSPDGKYLAVGGLSGIYLFDFQQFSLVSFIETNAWARSLAFLPGKDLLAAGLFDHTVKFWDVPSARLRRTLDDPQDRVRSISTSGDGSLIASASDDDTLRIWDVAAGTPVLLIQENIKGIRAVALSPDGKRVAGALGDNTLRVWSVPDGNLLYTLVGHTDWVRCLAFSPDSRLLASGAFDKNVLLWNMADGSLVRTLQGHSSSVLGVVFSPDGQLLASASVDTTARIWRVQDGSPVHVLQGHQDFVYSVAFSPDGKILASGAGDNTVRLWDLKLLENSPSVGESVRQPTPSDCRVCHHRRDTFEPAAVIEMRCEACHADGAGLAWCANFPRSVSGSPTPITYHPVQAASGVPVSDPAIAVLIGSPSNGETLYVRGDYLVPETISGKVFSADAAAITHVSVQLDILSGDQVTASQIAQPSASGEFSFNVDINPGSIPIQPVTLFCRGCHEKIGSGMALPHGEVHIVVTATTPDGSQALDERWFYVDSSGESDLPVQVLDDVTGEPIPGLSVQAETLLYEWRGRTIGAATDALGIAHLSLETLSQGATTYTIRIPQQIVRGSSYASDNTVQVSLEPGDLSSPTVTLTAHAQSGSITGTLAGDNLPAGLAGEKIWAFRLPGGPVYQAVLASDHSFTFESLPIDRYLVFTNPIAFVQAGFRAERVSLDLDQASRTVVSLPVTKTRFLSGEVTAQEGGSVLPFAWITVGEDLRAFPIDPASGAYLVSDLPGSIDYMTVSAPGYYSLALRAAPGQKEVDFQLVPRPDLQRLPWGEGEIILPPETIAAVNGSNIDLARGWLWGSGGTIQPLKIHLADLDVTIANGEFALESPVAGIPWFYVYEGTAQVLDPGGGLPITLERGMMIALIKGALPIPMEAAVTAGNHPILAEIPVLELVEPSIAARLESVLVKAGITAVQVTTLVAYTVSIAALLGIPLLVYIFRKKSLGAF